MKKVEFLSFEASKSSVFDSVTIAIDGQIYCCKVEFQPNMLDGIGMVKATPEVVGLFRPNWMAIGELCHLVARVRRGAVELPLTLDIDFRQTYAHDEVAQMLQESASRDERLDMLKSYFKLSLENAARLDSYVNRLWSRCNLS